MKPTEFGARSALEPNAARVTGQQVSAPAIPALSVRLFGAFEMALHGMHVAEPRAAKDQWLLALLLLSPDKPVRRDLLAQTLWPFPDFDAERAGANLRRSLAALRKALGSQAHRLASPSPDALAVNLTGAFVDLHEFDRAIAAGDRDSLAQAVSLHRAPLLLACLESWVLPERESRQLQYERARETLRSDPFPTVRSQDRLALRHNLPVQMTSFIGREHETAEVKALLHNTRLLTLAGSGGCGKTRLSQQVAWEVLAESLDGVWLVELAAISDPDQVVRMVAQILEVREKQGETVLKTLTESLRSRNLLLILDNCEHLVSACAQFTAGLLRACPYVKVLATSREALGISGEQTYRVPSLTCPNPTESSSVQNLSQYEAVRLFIDRAMLVKSDFAVSNQNAPALAQLCYRLDGIPLAIELAAAQIRSLVVEDVNARLDRRFRLLTGGDRSALPRQQTLRALIDWSYDLLNHREKMLLARLSVFAGGWSLEAAELVCSDTGSDLPAHPDAESSVEYEEVLGLLIRLVEKSLVISEDQEGSTRYRMLETVRQYAAERLQAAGATAQTRTRHLEWCLALAEEAGARLNGSEQAAWLRRLDREHDNLLAALSCCLANLDGAATGLRLSGALWLFWNMSGRWSTGREHLEGALERDAAPFRTRERATALRGAGVLAHAQGDYAQAQARLDASLRLSGELEDKSGVAWSMYYLVSVTTREDFIAQLSVYEECVQRFREIGDKSGLAWALRDLSWAAGIQGGPAAPIRTQIEESVRLFKELGDKRGLALSLSLIGDHEETLRLAREVGDKPAIARALISLGGPAEGRGEYIQARAHYDEGLRLSMELGDHVGVAWALISLGNMAVRDGDYAEARTRFDEGMRVSMEFRITRFIGWASHCLGVVAFRQGDYTAAQAHFEAGVRAYQEAGENTAVANGLVKLGDVAFCQGEYAAARAWMEEGLCMYRATGQKIGTADALESFAALQPALSDVPKAARLLGAVAAIRRSIDVLLPPYEQERYDRQLAEARSALGDAVFAAAWEEGSSMICEQALEYALNSISDQS